MISERWNNFDGPCCYRVLRRPKPVATHTGAQKTVAVSMYEYGVAVRILCKCAEYEDSAVHGYLFSTLFREYGVCYANYKVVGIPPMLFCSGHSTLYAFRKAL